MQNILDLLLSLLKLFTPSPSAKLNSLPLPSVPELENKPPELSTKEYLSFNANHQKLTISPVIVNGKRMLEVIE